MLLSRLKRLLRRKSRPTLVVPAPVLGSISPELRLTAQRRRRARIDADLNQRLTDSFLWGMWDVTERRPLWSATATRGLNGISGYGTHLYKMIYQPSNGGKRATVTYNASEAHTRLVGMLYNAQGQTYPATYHLKEHIDTE